jgi:uncharacterized protein YndB with AHSA1/START domain
MADIFHSFIINALLERVFDNISTTNGLDKWWSKKVRINQNMEKKFDM